jgi:hypothetical protein
MRLSLDICALVFCRRNSMPFVAIKMGRRQGGPSRTGGRGRIPHHFTLLQIWFFPAGIKMVTGRNQRATQPPTHFHRNHLGRGQLAVFPRCSLLTSRSIFVPVPATGAPRPKRRTKMGRDARRSSFAKQPTDLRRKACYFGDRTPSSRLAQECPAGRSIARLIRDSDN